MDLDKEIGKIINKTKYAGYYLNCIMGNFVSPGEIGSFDNAILNPNVTALGSKIKKKRNGIFHSK